MNCEIEFLPVGEGSKAGDAIVIRYGEPNSFELMVIDGGTTDSGKAVVNHIRQEFGNNATVAHVVLTHADADHASGLREVLSELDVTNLWLNMPWASATVARPYFINKNWTDDGLASALFKEYDLLGEIVRIAIERNVTIQEPYAGMMIGPFQILSPLRSVYPLFLAQFDRTPEPDQAAIEAAGFWIGKQPNVMAKLFEKVAAKAQTWVKETWDNERLRDGGITSASNETSVVLHGDFGPGRRVLLTGDAGLWALTLAACYAAQIGLPLQAFNFVQIPHHGSRRNVGPSILSRMLGPICSEGTVRFSAFVSAPKDDDTHPRKMVVNAFIRRGGRVVATQGTKTVYWGGFPPRLNYGATTPMPFMGQVEEYD